MGFFANNTKAAVIQAQFDLIFRLLIKQILYRSPLCFLFVCLSHKIATSSYNIQKRGRLYKDEMFEILDMIAVEYYTEEKKPEFPPFGRMWCLVGYKSGNPVNVVDGQLCNFEGLTCSLCPVCVCRHGDMLFLFPSGSSSSGEVMDTTTPHSSSSIASVSSSSSSSSVIPRSVSAPQVQEDEIDQYLAKQDGKIYRNKDPQLWESRFPQTPHSNARHLTLLLLLQMSPWRPWEMCALCTFRGKRILPFCLNIWSLLTSRGVYWQ